MIYFAHSILVRTFRALCKLEFVLYRGFFVDFLVGNISVCYLFGLRMLSNNYRIIIEFTDRKQEVLY